MLPFDPDVFVAGFIRGKSVHLFVTENGRDKVPPHCINGQKDPISGIYDIRVRATKVNVVALRMSGYITDGDARRILNLPV